MDATTVLHTRVSVALCHREREARRIVGQYNATIADIVCFDDDSDSEHSVSESDEEEQREEAEDLQLAIAQSLYDDMWRVCPPR